MTTHVYWHDSRIGKLITDLTVQLDLGSDDDYQIRNCFATSLKLPDDLTIRQVADIDIIAFDPGFAEMRGLSGVRLEQ